MNVLHVHSGNMFGGVERMLVTLAPATAGVAPLHSSYALCFDGQVGAALTAGGATVYPLGPVRARRADEIWRARRALRALLRERTWNVACVHSAWSQGIFGPVIRRSGVPLVRWMHAPDPGPRWMEAWSARTSADLAICNSDYTLAASRDRLGRTPSVVCYPASAPAPASASGGRDRLRHTLGTPPGAVVIAIAARMERWKGHEPLIDSLAALGDLDCEAWVIGGAQRPSERGYLDGLVDRAARSPVRVRFVGQQTDVASWLNAADIYCQPNVSPEPFGLSFVEALAAGCPVVTTRIGAAPEIVDDGCGVLVAPGAPGALAEALRRLVTDAAWRTRLRAGALRRGRDFCDVPRSIAALAQALARVAAPSLVLT